MDAINSKSLSGSYNIDDADRPRWTAETKPLARYEYRAADGGHAYFIDKGENPNGAKVFATKRRNLLSFGDRIEDWQKPDEFWGLGDVKPVLFNLPALAKADASEIVFFCEGEKDAQTLIDRGLLATTAPFGAREEGSSQIDYPAMLEVLKDRHVVILPDNDERGQAHALFVSQHLDGVAASVRIVRLPGLPPKGDVTDWIEAGKTVDNLRSVVDGTDPVPPAIAPPFSEEALALEFADRHVGELRFVAEWGKWVVWDGRKWVEDRALVALDKSRFLCREKAMKAPKKMRAALASGKTVYAVTRLAQSDRQLIAMSDQWDADPWLLNTPGGIVELRTGELKASDPSAYMTKSTAVTPGGDCPRWKAHLGKVTNGDKQLQGYIQRASGYSLTGSTQEHALFFFYGTGANGKSVTLETISGILGDYHRTSPVETFTENRNERHPTELAQLMGARLVTANETEEGRRWAESRIKSLTGGDKISARFMRQDFFEFTPQFKLIIAGNHKPGLRNVDEAIRRRLHLVPFTVTIPAEERDPNLKEALKAEWPGILQWMIEGCLEWQRIGLQPPEAVTKATDEYLGDEDLPSLWLEECCEKAKGAWTPTALLFSSWSAWARDGNDFPLNKKRFGQKLQDLGYTPEKRGKDGQRGFVGLKLKPVDKDGRPM